MLNSLVERSGSLLDTDIVVDAFAVVFHKSGRAPGVAPMRRGLVRFRDSELAARYRHGR